MNATISTKRRVATYCIFAAATLYALSTPVRATQGVHTIRVRFDDLNIADPAGAKVLYRRIHAAAREVCASYHRRDFVQSCVKKATENGVMKVNAPTLTALVPTRNIPAVSK
jgi:UrcA family protein